MHYYQFNIGDYASHTKGLSLMEDLAYRRLLDEYYLAERPFNGCSTDIARRIGMRDQVEAVEYVLSSFFTRSEAGAWVNERADAEIAAFKDKAEKASNAGKASAKARKGNAGSTDVQRPLDDRSTTVQPTINQEPLTSLKEVPTVHVETGVSPDAAPADFDCQVIPIKDPVPYEKILGLYHEVLPELAAVAKLTNDRKTKIRSRWKNDITSLDSWRQYFLIVRESSFLMGNAPPIPPRTKPFIADFDFLIKESNAIKVCEGKYHG